MVNSIIPQAPGSNPAFDIDLAEALSTGTGPKPERLTGLELATRDAPTLTLERALSRRSDKSYEGYTQRFETRPEYLFGQLVPAVVDASTLVRSRAVKELQVFPINKVFSGKDEVFFGFGKPNAYLTVPKADGSGYEKFAAKSLKRDVSRTEDTRGFVQAGIQLRFKNLPADAVARLREQMQKHDNQKYWTCVNANCRILEGAGFSSGEKPLSSRYFPVTMLKTLLKNGLYYTDSNGKRSKVEFDVVRTTTEPMEAYALGIARAEAATFWRHSPSALRATVGAIASLPARAWYAVTGHQPEEPKAIAKIAAPALPAGGPKDIEIRMSRPSKAGMLLRMAWGPHTLFQARQDRVDIDQFLPNALDAFPQANPSFATKLKSKVLFAQPVVTRIHKQLVSSWENLGKNSVSDIFSMVRTDSEANPNKYNLVMMRDVVDGKPKDTISVCRVDVGAGLVDWVMAKHVLSSNYHPSVRFAGEIWKDAEGTIWVSRNSGTYRPSAEQLAAAVRYLQKVFPGATVKAFEEPPAGASS
jgi:hypothetical protein